MLVWVISGLLAMEISDFHLHSTRLTFLIVFVAWWGVAMLLVRSGLRVRSLPGALFSILILLMFTFWSWVFVTPDHGSHRARVTEALTQIDTFRVALDAFHTDNGSFPSGTNGLQDLVRQPSWATNWHGPYLAVIPKDPWGNAYIYVFPGSHGPPHPYDIISARPSETNIMAANWQLKPLLR